MMKTSNVSSDPSSSQSDTSIPGIKRRNRMPLACTVCRKRKVKCDRSRPACKVCTKYRVAHLCQYQQPTWANSNSEDLKLGKFSPSSVNDELENARFSTKRAKFENSQKAKITNGNGNGDNAVGGNDHAGNQEAYNTPMSNTNASNNRTKLPLNNNNNTTFTDSNNGNTTTTTNSNTHTYPLIPPSSYDSGSSDLLHRAVSHIGSNERSFINPVARPLPFPTYNSNNSGTTTTILSHNHNEPQNQALLPNGYQQQQQQQQQQPGSFTPIPVDDSKPVMTELQFLKEKIKQIEASISSGERTQNDMNQKHSQPQQPYTHSAVPPHFQLPRISHPYHEEEQESSQTYSQTSTNSDPSIDQQPSTRKSSITSTMVLPPIQNWKPQTGNQSNNNYPYQANSPPNPSLLNSYQSSNTNKNYNILPPLVPFSMVPQSNSHRNSISAASPSLAINNNNPKSTSSMYKHSSSSPPSNIRTASSPLRQQESMTNSTANNTVSTVLPPIRERSNDSEVYNPNNTSPTEQSEARRQEMLQKGIDFKGLSGMPAHNCIVPIHQLGDSSIKPNTDADSILIATADRSNEIKSYLLEKFKVLGIDPNEVLELQEGYAPIHARESRVKNHGALSWITILKKDPFLKMMWFKLLEFKKSQKVKLARVQRKSLESEGSKMKKKSNEHTFRDRLLEQEGIVDMQPYEQQSDKDSKLKQEETGELKTNDKFINKLKEAAEKFDKEDVEVIKKQETETEVAVAPTPNTTVASSTNVSGPSLPFKINISKSSSSHPDHPQGLLERAIIKDKDGNSVLNIVKALPKRKVIWLLIDHFFNYNYAYLPYVDEETFINDVENLIGPRSYEDVEVKSIYIPRRVEFANIGLLLVILRLSYLSLLQNYDSEYIPKKTEDEEYLLRNPIDVEVMTVAQLCLNQFKLSSTCSLSIFQCTLFMRLYNGYAPEESDLNDSGDPQLFTGMLIEMATVIGLNREPTRFSSNNVTPKFVNLWRKLWYCLVACDAAQSISMCNPRMIDPNFYDTKLPEFTEEGSNVSNLELENHIILSIRSKFELNSRMTDITRCILNIKHPATSFELLERLFTLESVLSETASILDLMVPASENKVLNMLRLKKMNGHLESISLVHSLLYRILLHYDEIGNIKACRFICDKILSLIVVVISVFNELLKYGPKYFGPYADLYLTRTLEASMHKCLHFQLSIFSRCLVFMQTRTNKTNQTPEEERENEETIKAIKSVMNDCVLQNVVNYIKGLSLISGRYYHAWRMSKAQNFILYLIKDHDFIMSEFNKLAESDQTGVRIIPQYSLFEGYTADDFKRLRNAFDVEKYLDSQGISIVNDEFVFHSRDAKQSANESVAAAALISVSNTPANNTHPQSYDINSNGNNNGHEDVRALYAPHLKSREDVDNFWMELLTKKQNVDPFGNLIDFSYSIGADQQYSGGYNFDNNDGNNYESSHSLDHQHQHSGTGTDGTDSAQYATPIVNNGSYGNGNSYDGLWLQNEIDVEQLPGYGLHDTDLLFNSYI